jgi:hypothetical protein
VQLHSGCSGRRRNPMVKAMRAKADPSLQYARHATGRRNVLPQSIRPRAASCKSTHRPKRNSKGFHVRVFRLSLEVLCTSSNYTRKLEAQCSGEAVSCIARTTTARWVSSRHGLSFDVNDRFQRNTLTMHIQRQRSFVPMFLAD